MRYQKDVVVRFQFDFIAYLPCYVFRSWICSGSFSIVAFFYWELSVFLDLQDLQSLICFSISFLSSKSYFPLENLVDLGCRKMFEFMEEKKEKCGVAF